MKFPVTTYFGDVLTEKNVIDLDGDCSRFFEDDPQNEYGKLHNILNLGNSTDDIFYYIKDTITNILNNGTNYLFELFRNTTNAYEPETIIDGTKIKRYARRKIYLKVQYFSEKDYLTSNTSTRDPLYYVKYEVFISDKFHAEFFVILPKPIEYYKDYKNKTDIEIEYY
nr:MAG TPA: hypothetical protein [Caudoviricetes sp.]